MFAYGFSVGVICYFLLCRAVDKLTKRSGCKANYDCGHCSAHCVGYHCYVQRLAEGEQNEVSDVSAEDSD